MLNMMSFKWVALFYLFVFFGVLALATYIALNRRSGNTGMDVGKIHLMRENP